MPRTSTAERSGYVCPLCGEALARDTDHKGWVRHKARPDVERLLAEDATRSMMTDEEARYLAFYGLCPFERGLKDAMEPEQPPRFRFLEPRQGSQYRQWFLVGRRIRAESLYERTVGEEAWSPEQVAADFDLPVEAVLEAVEYCEQNADLLAQEREEDWADIRSRGWDRPAVAAVGESLGP